MVSCIHDDRTDLPARGIVDFAGDGIGPAFRGSAATGDSGPAGIVGNAFTARRSGRWPEARAKPACSGRACGICRPERKFDEPAAIILGPGGREGVMTRPRPQKAAPAKCVTWLHGRKILKRLTHVNINHESQHGKISLARFLVIQLIMANFDF